MPPTLEDMDPTQEQWWDDVHSRNFMTAQLILDTRPGMLDTMVDSTYPGQTGGCSFSFGPLLCMTDHILSGELPFGQRPVFGEDIKEAARALSPA